MRDNVSADSKMATFISIDLVGERSEQTVSYSDVSAARYTSTVNVRCRNSLRNSEFPISSDPCPRVPLCLSKHNFNV